MSAAQLLEQLRAGGVSDERVLAAIATVPRERFVPAGVRTRAWENVPLPIGADQTISQPQVVAVMCAALDVRAGERVLDVGTGSGYHAAVLAALGARVWSVERHRRLAEQARRDLATAGVAGVEVVVGDGREGHPAAAPYDAISVAATAENGVPGALIAQLAPRGRLVAPVRDERGEHLLLLRRDAAGIRSQELGPVRFVPLLGGLAD